MRQFTLTILFVTLACSASAQEPAPTPMHKLLMGHWAADKDSHLHFYFSQRRRVYDNNHPDSDAALSIIDYQLWDEWPEARSVVVAYYEEGTQNLIQLFITFSDDSKTANVREKSGAHWTRAYRLRRVDDKMHPVTLPVKLKVLDMEAGLGTP